MDDEAKKHDSDAGWEVAFNRLFQKYDAVCQELATVKKQRDYLTQDTKKLAGECEVVRSVNTNLEIQNTKLRAQLAKLKQDYDAAEKARQHAEFALIRSMQHWRMEDRRQHEGEP